MFFFFSDSGVVDVFFLNCFSFSFYFFNFCVFLDNFSECFILFFHFLVFGFFFGHVCFGQFLLLLLLLFLLLLLLDHDWGVIPTLCRVTCQLLLLLCLLLLPLLLLLLLLVLLLLLLLFLLLLIKSSANELSQMKQVNVMEAMSGEEQFVGCLCC